MKEANLLSHKADLREQFKSLRQSILSSLREKAAIDAANRFKHLEGNILTFASFSGEIDLWPLNRYLAQKKVLILPRIERVARVQPRSFRDELTELYDKGGAKQSHLTREESPSFEEGVLQNQILSLYLVEDIRSQLTLSALNILEPDPRKAEKIAPDQIDIALIPGLAFDAQLHRLGYGKGFYDRLLPKLSRAHKIGIGFTCQLMQSPLPTSDYDEPLDELALF